MSFHVGSLTPSPQRGRWLQPNPTLSVSLTACAPTSLFFDNWRVAAGLARGILPSPRAGLIGIRLIHFPRLKPGAICLGPVRGDQFRPEGAWANSPTLQRREGQEFNQSPARGDGFPRQLSCPVQRGAPPLAFNRVPTRGAMHTRSNIILPKNQDSTPCNTATQRA